MVDVNTAAEPVAGYVLVHRKVLNKLGISDSVVDTIAAQSASEQHEFNDESPFCVKCGSTGEDSVQPVAHILPRMLKILKFKSMPVPVDPLPYDNGEEKTVPLYTTPPATQSALTAALSDCRIVEYSSPDSRTMNAWANDIDTTESGAYGICLAAVEAVESLVAVRRAETLTGADWYVAPIGTDPQDLELCFRLEVSGVDAGGKSVVDARLRQKVEQTRKGNSNVPAIASVVGFKELTVAIQRVGDSQ